MKNKKTGRNDPCPCGSGLKFKKCCYGKQIKPTQNIKELYLKKYNIRLKSKTDIKGIKIAGRLAIKLLTLLKQKSGRE